MVFWAAYSLRLFRAASSAPTLSTKPVKALHPKIARVQDFRENEGLKKKPELQPETTRKLELEASRAASFRASGLGFRV